MQNWTDDIPNSGDQYGSDLDNIKNNFATLKSIFSGTSAPPNTVEGMPWLDMNSGKAWKVRDKGNANWLGYMVADGSHKIWVYRNTAPEGWAIDSSVTDVVLALKGGSQAYNANGGTQVGTWQQAGHSLSIAELAIHSHPGDPHGHTFYVDEGGGTVGGTSSIPMGGQNAANTDNGSTDSGGTGSSTGSTGSGAAHDHGNTWRPAAAVGTLQYLNV